MIEAPTEPGFYHYSGGRQTMVFLLRTIPKTQWAVIMDNGDTSVCEWGYIEQALGVWDLVPLGEKSEAVVEGSRGEDGLRLTRYDCGVEGHIMDQWTSLTARQGAQPPMQSRRCIIPTCKPRFVQTRKAPMS